MSRLPDPARSRVVLVGCSHYDHLEDLPAVSNNLRALRSLLTDPAIGAFDRWSCSVIEEPGSPRRVFQALRDAAHAADDTLVVYFAGHGLLDERNQLHLALAEADPDLLQYTALSYDHLRAALGESAALNRVVILDCCFAGRAITDMAGRSEGILGQTRVEGTYILAAAPADKTALAPEGSTYTAFTGVLLELLRGGIADGPELVTLDLLFPRLRAALLNRRFPEARRSGTDTVTGLALTRNPAYRFHRDVTLLDLQPVQPDPVWQPGKPTGTARRAAVRWLRSAPAVVPGVRLPTPFTGRRGTISVAGAALAVVALVTATIWLNGRSGAGIGPATPATSLSASAFASTAGATPTGGVTSLNATILSFDPTSHSEFREIEGTWRTQNYMSSTFGGLKPGCGLLLDLGTPQRLDTVTLDAVTGPLTVDLRALDRLPTALADLSLVSGPVSGSGHITLPASDGGAHRYWLIWVTRLAGGSGLFSAEIRDPAAHPFTTTPTTGTVTVPVPALNGTTIEQAKAALAAVGLQANDIVEPVDGKGLKKNLVVSSIPASGAAALRGSKVVLTVSNGKTTIPSEKGKTRTDAIDDLHAQGITDITVIKVPSDQTPDTVIDQDPQPSDTQAFTRMTLTVAMAPPK